LAVVANNIANQSTAAYATEVGNQSALNVDGIGMGVVSTATTRDINLSLQDAVFSQNATVAGLNTQSTALSAIDDVSGTTGTGNDLPSLLGNLQDAFTTLSSTPDSQADQAAVVNAASVLTSGINNISSTITAQRQTAQSNIAANVTTLNNSLAQIGALNTQIVSNQAAALSTAALENQRDVSEQAISSILDVKFVAGANGAVQVMTNSGLTLPTDGTQIETSDATITANSTYPSDIPAITMGGTDITQSLLGGSLGASINLRDTVLPARQAELDEFSEQLATRFSAQGLNLFTDGSGNVPTAGSPTQTNYVGFSARIQVNPSVTTNVALVRDGTQSVTGSTSGASSFTTNTAGTADFSTLINRVLTYSFGDDIQSGVAQTSIPTSGLGSNGLLSVSYNPGDSLTSFVTAMSASDATAVTDTSSQLTSETDTQTNLQNQLSAGSAVSIDTQMSNMVQLQNAYAANAKILTSVQSMWTDLFNAVNAS
jgi:flagellar hook-associated protein 1 FlgK